MGTFARVYEHRLEDYGLWGMYTVLQNMDTVPRAEDSLQRVMDFLSSLLDTCLWIMGIVS